MVNLLVVYDRAAGRLLREREYADSQEALAASFAVEREHHGDPNIEVVVLHAASRDQIVESHSRYFYSLSELVDRLERSLTPPPATAS